MHACWYIKPVNPYIHSCLFKRFCQFKGKLCIRASIAEKKRAYIFAGRSGAGKTTISRLSQKRILNDEITAVRIFKKGDVRVFGTPFWGEMGSGPVFREVFKLKSLFFIKKSFKNDRKSPFSPVIALPRLLKCCCYFGKDPSKINQVLEVAVDLLSMVPVFQLFFTRSREFLRIIKSL